MRSSLKGYSGHASSQCADMSPVCDTAGRAPHGCRGKTDPGLDDESLLIERAESVKPREPCERTTGVNRAQSSVCFRMRIPPRRPFAAQRNTGALLSLHYDNANRHEISSLEVRVWRFVGHERQRVARMPCFQPGCPPRREQFGKRWYACCFVGDERCCKTTLLPGRRYRPVIAIRVQSDSAASCPVRRFA